MLQLAIKGEKVKNYIVNNKRVSLILFFYTQAESGSIKKVSNDGNKKFNHKLFTKLSLNKVHIWIVLVGFFSQYEGLHVLSGDLALKKILVTDHSSMGSLHCESPNVGATSRFAKTLSNVGNGCIVSP
jgi:hypothetical protein